MELRNFAHFQRTLPPTYSPCFYTLLVTYVLLIGWVLIIIVRKVSIMCKITFCAIYQPFSCNFMQVSQDETWVRFLLMSLVKCVLVYIRSSSVSSQWITKAGQNKQSKSLLKLLRKQDSTINFNQTDHELYTKALQSLPCRAPPHNACTVTPSLYSPLCEQF